MDLSGVRQARLRYNLTLINSDTNCDLIVFNLRSTLLARQKVTKNSLNQHEENVEATTRNFPAELPGPEYTMELVWRNIIIFVLLHIGAIYGYYTPKRSWATVWFSKFALFALSTSS